VRHYLCGVFLLLPIYALSAVTDRVIATVSVGNSPSGIAVTPNNRFAYVANNDNAGLPNGNTVSVINLATNMVVKTISNASFNQPYTVTINAAGTKAYVTNSNSTTITIINTATNTVTGIIDGFDGPSGMVITPSGDRAYVNNYGGPEGVKSGNGKTVRIVNLTTNSIIGAPITVGLAPAAITISPDGAFVYTINYETGNPGTGTMSIIQTSTNKVVGTIGGFSGPFAIALTSDGNYAYVTNFGSNNFSPVGTTVSVVNLRSRAIVKTIKVGTQPSGIAITPDGRFAYVTNYNTLYLGPNFTLLTPGPGIVNIIDIATNKVLPQLIMVGKSPADVTISPDGRFAYVTNYASNTVSVINIVDNAWLKMCAQKVESCS